MKESYQHGLRIVSVFHTVSNNVGPWVKQTWLSTALIYQDLGILLNCLWYFTIGCPQLQGNFTTTAYFMNDFPIVCESIQLKKKHSRACLVGLILNIRTLECLLQIMRPNIKFQPNIYPIDPNDDHLEALGAEYIFSCPCASSSDFVGYHCYMWHRLGNLHHYHKYDANCPLFSTYMIDLLYSISQEICTRFLLCCALLWLYIDWFSHIHQAYFTGTVAI